VDWDQLALDRDKGRAFVKTVLHLRVYKMRGIFWPDEEVLASVEGIYWLELGNYMVGWLVGWLDSYLVCIADVRNIVTRNSGDSNIFNTKKK